MDSKRVSFPRFYFLSNDELIDILANSQNLDIIQGHLKTCFDNIVRLDIEADGEITHMNSAEKEKVEFKKPIKTKATQVEVWLMELQKAMKDILGNLMSEGMKNYGTQERKQFVIDHKGQIVATVA